MTDRRASCTPARAVLPAAAGEQAVTVTVAGGRIVGVGPLDRSVTGRPDGEVVELGDDVVLLPGLVDTHVHVNEPGRTEWEGFASATRAAAAGGVTTIVDMPLNSLPPTLDPEALAVKRAAAEGKCVVDVGFWGGAVPGNLGRLGALLDAGVMGVKCFLPDSGVEEFPALSSAGLLAAAEEVAAADGLLLVHAEDPGVLAGAPAASGPAYADVPRVAPASAEDRAIDAVIDAARRTGARLHVVHLSSAAALPALAAAKADGVRVTVETCPHYLVLRAEDVPDGATPFKCCPPVRDEANREALWAGLADGTIDLVVSDHSPCTAELKHLDTGDFGTAWGGISSLQLGLPAGVDRGAPARALAGRRGALDVVSTGRRWSGSPRRAGSGPGRRRRPRRVRPGRRAGGRPVAAAPPQRGVAVRRCAAHRRGARDVVGWGAGRRGPAGSGDRTAAVERGGVMAQEEATGEDPLALPDLAVRTFGGAVVWANDELFAGRENLINPGPAAFTPRTFGAKGQVYDGWETRAATASPATTRPSCGSVRPVWCAPWSSTPATSPATSRARRRSRGWPSTGTRPSTICARPSGRRWSSARRCRATPRTSSPSRRRDGGPTCVSRIHPDGGVARLRVHGEVVADPRPSRRSAPSTSPRSTSAAGSPAAATCSTARRTG